MEEKRDLIQIREAQEAARDALASLDRVEERLKSAGNWGLFDLLGGGFVSTLVKHSKMDEAEAELDAAKAALGRLQKELRDVDAEVNFHVDVKGLLKFTDYFLDDIVSDWIVNSKIDKAREQAAGARRKVAEILERLGQMEAESV